MWMSSFNLENLFFWYLAVVMVATSFLAIVARNPVYTLLFILVMIIHQAFLLLLLGSEFLMVVQIIIYAGAVIVLFLFVVYLINLRAEKRKSLFVKKVLFGMIGFVIFGVMLSLNFYMLFGKHLFQKGKFYFDFKENPDVWWIANYLFNFYLLPFEVLGVILLVVILGVVFLVKKVKVQEEK